MGNEIASDLDNYPNIPTMEAMYKCERYLLNHYKILVSISGGSDSDDIIEIIQLVLKENKYNYNCDIRYVFFNTGIEMKPTLEHLDYLEKRFGITIERIRANIPVPLGCRKYGLPF